MLTGAKLKYSWLNLLFFKLIQISYEHLCLVFKNTSLGQTFLIYQINEMHLHHFN